MREIITGLCLLFVVPSVFYFWNYLIYLELYKPKLIKDYDPSKIYLFYYGKKGYGSNYHEKNKKRKEV